MRDQDDLLEELAHPQEFLDEQFPRHLRVQGPEVAFVDEQGLHAAERPADLRHRGELPCDREPQRRVDLGLLAPAELRHVVPLAVDALHEDPHSVAASLLVRLEADPAEAAVRELREILRCLDLEFRQELLDREHHDPPLVEHAIHEHVVDLEIDPERVPGAFRLLQFLRVPCEPRDLLLHGLGLPLQKVPRFPFLVQVSLQRFEAGFRRGERLLGGPKIRNLCLQGGPLRFERRPLHAEVGEPRRDIAHLPQERREFIEPTAFCRPLLDRGAHGLHAFLIVTRETHRVELSKRLDLRVVEGLDESMALVRFPPEVVLQLLELPLVLREDERILVDRRDLLVDSGERLLRAGLFFAQLADEVSAIREPCELARDPSDPLLEAAFIAEGTERGLSVDIGPEGGDLAMELVDAVLDFVPPLLVLPFCEVELPLRGACRGLALVVQGLRLLESVEFLPQSVQVRDIFLQRGTLGLQFRGDLTLRTDFLRSHVQGLQPSDAVFESGGGLSPSLVFRLEVLHVPRDGLVGRLELGNPRPASGTIRLEVCQLLPEQREPGQAFLPRGDFRVLRLDMPFHGRVVLLRPLQGLLENLEPEQFLEDGEALRPARGAQLLHLFLTHEGRIPEAVVIQSDHIADRPLFVRDRALDRLAVPRHLEVRLFLRREPARDVPPFVALSKGDPDVAARPADVRELHAQDVRPSRLRVQGERDRVEDRGLARARAARDDREFLRESQRWVRLLEIPHEPAHLDLLEHESLSPRRMFDAHFGNGCDGVGGLHVSASFRTRRASTLIASRLGWSARTLSM